METAMKNITNIIVLLIIFSISPLSQANGLTEVKNVLNKLNGYSPFSANVESAYTEKRGKKKKQKTKKGLITLTINDTTRGFELLYSKETLRILDKEISEKEQNDEADTPTLNAVNHVGISEMKEMTSSAASLLRFINKATFVNEQNITRDGRQLRQLNFTLPLNAIIDNKEIYEYVDEFEGNYQLVIDDNGVPIDGTISFNGSGSAYVFFTMSMTQNNTLHYRLINDRLVNVRKTFQSKRRSTWGKTESSGYKILIINSATLDLKNEATAQLDHADSPVDDVINESQTY